MHKTDPDRLRQRRIGHIAVMATLICAVPVAANATTRNVPGTYANIQAAVTAASNGDTIAVAAGTYTGAGNIDIDTSGKAITIQGAGATSTIINVNANSGNQHLAFFIHNGETSSTIIRGFTIENAYDGPAGAMSLAHTSPTIDQCIFLNNNGTQGGAINITDGSPKISNSVFINNVTRGAGGGEFGGAIEIINDTTTNGAGTVSNTVTIVNDSFVGNTSTGDGGAIDITGEDVGSNAAVNSVPIVNIDNCSFSRNTAQNDSASGGGVIDFFGGKVTVSNSILYGDISAEISTADPPATGSVIRNSDIQGGYTGTGASGIVNFDPLYENTVGNDLRLKAKSPAINDGTHVSTSPTTDLLTDTRDSNIDMGAYEYLLAGAATTINPTQGSSFSGQVASFIDTDGEVDTPGTFSATINWGDGNSSAGTVTQPGGSGTAYVVSGTHTYAVSGSETVSVTFTDSNPDGPHVTGSESASETVTPAPATGFTVSAPSSATAGSSFNFTVTATAAGGGATTNYNGTVHFTSSDGQAVLPANATLTNGVGTFSATLGTAGNQTITATDTVTSSITGTSGAITVAPAAATQIIITGSNPETSSVAFGINLTAKDAFGNTATGYNGTVTFTSSDSAFTNPGPTTFVNGSASATTGMRVAGTQTITATDTVNSSITGTGTFTIVPGPAHSFTVSAPANATAGTPVFFTVTAHDLWGNPVTSGPNNYSGTVHFTTSDRYGAVPADSPIEGGSGTFQVTFGTVGTQTITATDTTTSSITGTSGGTLVGFGPAVLFGIRVRSTTVVDGAPFALNVFAYDHYGNQVTNYSGTVHFTSSDPNAVLPADTTLVNGQGSFSATLYTLGSQSITATDTVTSSINGTQGFTVIDNPATHFRLSASPAAAAAGVPVTVTVVALDASGNTARGYTGTVHISSNAAGAVLPSNATLTNGTGTFQITFTTVGRYTVTATDLSNSSITGTSGTVVVSGGAATQFTVMAQSSAVAGKAFGVVVKALDAYGNIATGYDGTVHFTSTDANAVLPSDGALYSGQRTFLVTLKTPGSQTVTATDTVNSGITATTGNITVTAH